MTFSAYNAPLAIHEMNVLDDPHRVREAPGQSTADYQAWAAKRNAETVAWMAAAGGNPTTLTVADGVISMVIEDAIWYEIPQIAPLADAVAEDQV